jgi:hypothetical protein
MSDAEYDYFSDEAMAKEEEAAGMAQTALDTVEFTIVEDDFDDRVILRPFVVLVKNEEAGAFEEIERFESSE